MKAVVGLLAAALLLAAACTAPLVPGMPIAIDSLHMVTATTGWAMTGGEVLRTTDGAARWHAVTPPGIAAGVPAAYFLDGQTAWVGSEGALFRTTDGGRTWRQAAVPFRHGTLHFAGARHGWALVSGGAALGSSPVEVFHTADGGLTWSLVAATGPDARGPGQLPFGGSKSGIAFRDADTGWVTGDDPSPVPLIYRSRDGGRTWARQNLPVPTALQGAQPVVEAPRFWGRLDGILPVRYGPTTVFFVTSDGGDTWVPTTPVERGPFDFISAVHGWVLAPGGRLRATNDGGRTWAEILPDVSLEGVRQLDFVSGSVGWALGERLLRTGDGGRTWRAVPAQRD